MEIEKSEDPGKPRTSDEPSKLEPRKSPLTFVRKLGDNIQGENDANRQQAIGQHPLNPLNYPLWTDPELRSA